MGTVIGLVISAAILVSIALWKDVRPAELGRHFGAASLSLLAVAFVISSLFHVVLGPHKLWLVLRDMGADISLADTMRVVLGMGPLQLLLPLKGGVAVAVLYLWRHERMPLARAAGALSFDRGLNFAAIGIWLMIGVAAMPTVGLVRHTEGLIVASAVLLVMLLVRPIHDLIIAAARLLHPRLARVAEGVLVPWRALGIGRKLLFLAYSMVVVLRPFVVCGLLFRAYHQTPGLPEVLVYTAVAVFAGQLPGPLMGMGPREGALLELAGEGLGGEAVVLSVGLLLSLCAYVGPMLLGLPWVPWLTRRLALGDTVEEAS